MPLDSFEKIVSSTALDSNDTDVSKENGIFLSSYYSRL